MRILRIGDPHIKPSNIEEADRLMAFAKEIIIGSRTGGGVPITRLEILGDLFHTHAIIRVEVLDFWNKWLQIFSSVVETIVLVGNHDQTGDYNNGTHALRSLKNLMVNNPNLRIVDIATVVGVYGYLPYIHDKQLFLNNAKYLADQGAKILVCHATFDGSTFENGFYAPEGIDPNLVPFKKIISGHIHREQVIAGGKVDYPGTPKWDSASDANEKKGIWLYEHDDDGNVINRDMIPTDGRGGCIPIVSFTWVEGEPAPVIPEDAKAAVELIGSSEWVTKNKAGLKGKVSIKSKITDKKKSESRKVGTSFESFLASTFTTTMDKNEILEFAREIGVA